MTLAEAAALWVGLGLAGLGIMSFSYQAVPPLWLALLTVVAGPAAFGASLVTLLMKIGDLR